MTKIPSDDVLESLYELSIRDFDQLKTVLELYDMEIHQKISMPDYQKLKTMVKRSINQKLGLRNFDARNEKIETGAVVTSRRGQKGVERGQGECYHWKAKRTVSRGDTCSFWHDEDKRAKPTPKTAPSSELPTQSCRNSSRRKNLRGRSPSGKFARQPCKDYLTCICTKSPCDYRHPPECQFSRSESVCKFCDKCSFAHRQVEGQPSKKPKMDGDKSAVAILKMYDSWVACFRTQSRRNLYRFYGGAQKSWNQFDECNSHANIRESNGPSLGVIQIKNPHQRSPYTQNLRIGLRKRLKDRSDVFAETRGDRPRIC